eukprot:m.31412 g.31412  ORF g.31412 m.31412 type:complete len:147 (-) comp9741_c0_seq1:68-508(-)
MAAYHEILYDDGDQYKGEWSADGKREGFGVLTFADGSRYAGRFAQGLCHGFGSLSFPDNSKYEGEFANGKYNGFGVYQRADGMKYEGSFREGQAHGLGLLTFADGSSGRPRQEGEWNGPTLVKRMTAANAVRQAQEAAAQARAQAN